MSHLDYLNHQEWKKLGIISITALCTPSIFFIVFGFILSTDIDVVSEIGILSILKYLSTVSIGYATFYSTICFLIMYFKGEKVFKKLIFANFFFLIGVIVLFIFMLIFGPHG